VLRREAQANHNVVATLQWNRGRSCRRFQIDTTCREQLADFCAGVLPGLQGVSSSLVQQAIENSEFPQHLLSSHCYQQFTPVDHFLSLPGDVTRTEFRLAGEYCGEEYTLLERALGCDGEGDLNMLVTVVEFDTLAPMIGPMGVEVSLVAYPLIALKRSFLEDSLHRLITHGCLATRTLPWEDDRFF